MDDLIENYQKQIGKLVKLGLSKINNLNDTIEHKNLSSLCKFEKGIEIGSANYVNRFSDNSIHYLRVGDLDSLSETYIQKEIAKNFVKNNDILIAFDGAPGRNAIGIEGAFSSGIYKILCDSKNKGLIYFELNSKLNQRIIKDHSQGTTILHASKAIPFLEMCDCRQKDVDYLNRLFLRMVNLKRKISLLTSNKKTLLEKHF